MSNGDGLLPPGVGHYGEPVAGGGVSFRCAACGEMAAVVRLVRAGTPVDMGPPMGEETYDRDGVVDYWLGTTCWRRLDPAAWSRIEAVLSSERPDPAELHKIRAMSPPHIAAWGDLDAHGIAIITDLAARLGRQVHPVGMEPELFRSGVKRRRTDLERQEAINLATRLATTALEPLRPLAALIAATGDSCEQETVRARVTPYLGETLCVIEAGGRPVMPS
jgi:hypothetical protein